MNEIKAYLRKSKMNEVVQGLKDLGVKVMSIILVERIGSYMHTQASELDLHRQTDISTVIKLELVCRKKDTDLIVNALKKLAHTGEQGDGAIFISPVERAIKIRSGEEGEITLDSHNSSSSVETG